MQLPLSTFFTQLKEEALFELALTATLPLLQHLAHNKADGYVNNLVEESRTYYVTFLGVYEFSAPDISQMLYIQKKGLTDLLPKYTSSVTLLISIIGELDILFATIEDTIKKKVLLANTDTKGHPDNFLQNINDTSPGIIYLYNVEQRTITFVNNKIEELPGYSNAELKAMSANIDEMLHYPDDRQKVFAHLNDVSVINDGQKLQLIHHIKHKNGQYKWLNNSKTIYRRNAKGAPWQILGIAVDIDELMNVSEQLKKREEQLLQAHELAGLGSFEWNLETYDGTTTPQLLIILGYSDKSELNQFSSHIHHDDRPRVKKLVEEATKTLSIYDYECRFFAGNVEKVIWVRGNVCKENGVLCVKGTIMDVSHRYRLIERLKQSEILFKQAEALSHIGNYIFDLTTQTIMWSDELFRIYNIPYQETSLTAAFLGTFNHPDDEMIVETEMKKGFEVGHHDFFYRIRLKNGDVKFLHAKGQTVYDEASKPIKIIGNAQDVTRQKLIEKELLEKQYFITKLTDATPSIITLYNLRTKKYLYVSAGLQKLLGYNPSEIITNGTTFVSSIIHPGDLAAIINKNKLAVEHIRDENEINDKKPIIEYRFRVLNTQGVYLWMQSYGTVFDRRADGSVESLLHITVDITDTIEKENKLLEQEYFIKHIAEASPTILYLFNLVEQKFIYINREVKSVLGYEPEELIGHAGNVKTFYLHPDDNVTQGKRFLNEVNSSNGSNIHQFEARVKHKNEQWVWMLTREIIFKRDKNGKPLQVLGSALDITARKQMEQSIVYKTHLLQQSNASLEAFANVASHDLQEPMRKIATFGDRLLTTNRDLLTNDGKIYLDKMIRSAQRMQQLINDVLSISLISAEKKFTTANLQKILDDVLSSLDYKIDETGAEITFDQLPVARVNISQFNQLFQNLISNSIKFSKKDVVPKISITHKYLTASNAPLLNLQSAPGYLQITFNDNGIGFENTFAEKIFVIFQRLNGHASYEGTGIGLSICKKIVENHGGQIFAESKLGEGATFTVVVPDNL